jgi:hypothetical protein
MARSGLPRKQRRLEALACWLETFWACRCAYYNVATYRCKGCGRRPPRALRAHVTAVAPVVGPVDVPPEREVVDARR